MGPHELADQLEEIAKRLRDPREPVIFFVAVYADAYDGGRMVRVMRNDCDPRDVARAMGEAQQKLGTGAVVPVSKMPEQL